jgi:hypothetical protein
VVEYRYNPITSSPLSVILQLFFNSHRVRSEVTDIKIRVTAEHVLSSEGFNGILDDLLVRVPEDEIVKFAEDNGRKIDQRSLIDLRVLGKFLHNIFVEIAEELAGKDPPKTPSVVGLLSFAQVLSLLLRVQMGDFRSKVQLL